MSAPGDPAAGTGLAERLERITGTAVREARPVGTQHKWSHYRVILADGREAFAKAARADLGGIFEAEARGLRWLADAHAAPVPEVLGWDAATLAVAWVPAQAPDQPAAEQFGRDLAVLHAAGAERFGAPWPGFIASLPLGDRAGDAVTVAAETTAGGGAGDWANWYAAKRLLPYLRRAAGTGALDPADTRVVEEVVDRIAGLAGPAEPPSRIHGDCWSGNLLWSAGRGWLIDPAAQGGHRETDLAMLALFGAPHLDRILAAYQEVAPLAAGWRERVPLHQLHPLLVHACLFGSAYREAVVSAARAALAC
ncbi:MAG TPA: fructosamine kinase family protein [Streptosporangiaceae bacterium]|nr:fructosamine kinase family protein [Streptosporangiaceae bacterium]